MAMPKRNKSKDNPYTLGYNEDKNTYTVEFAIKNKHKIIFEDSKIIDNERIENAIEHYNINCDNLDFKINNKTKLEFIIKYINNENEIGQFDIPLKIYN